MIQLQTSVEIPDETIRASRKAWDLPSTEIIRAKLFDDAGNDASSSARLLENFL